MSIPSQGFGGGAPNKFEACGEGRGASMRATRAVGTAKNLSIIYSSSHRKRSEFVSVSATKGALLDKHDLINQNQKRAI